jgi:hypothetical protein
MSCLGEVILPGDLLHLFPRERSIISRHGLGGKGISPAIITRMEALLIVILLGGFVFALATTFLVSRRPALRPVFACTPTHTHLVTLRRRTVLCSRSERNFYQTLRSLIPDHMIFVKVKLADLVPLKPHHSFWEHFSPINRKHIDFVICDQTLAPVVAIELDRANSTSDIPALNLMNSVLASASLPIVHVPQKRRYVFNELRRLLAPYLTVPRPLL